jgi:hypothetical protein
MTTRESATDRHHSHSFEHVEWTGRGRTLRAVFRCPCGAYEIRRPTKAERAEFRAEERDCVDTHRVWGRFCYLFLVDHPGKAPRRGYVLMRAVSRWAMRYQNDVRIVRCEDDSFRGSYIVLIEHRTAQSYMGTSVVFIQQGGSEPQVMFLYPRAADDLIRELQSIRRAARPIERLEHRRSTATQRSHP